MKQTFNVGDKVLYKSNTGQEYVCTVSTIKQMYTISNDDMFATVSPEFISEYKPNISEATVSDIIEELLSRGYTEVELKRDDVCTSGRYI